MTGESNDNRSETQGGNHEVSLVGYAPRTFSADDDRNPGFCGNLTDRSFAIIGNRCNRVAFQESVKNSIELLQNSGFSTAHNELREALHDLSRRPNPDISGAIHHAMEALESTARKICGNDKMTLGGLIKKNPQIFPRPLDEAVTKAWGYASESGRHIKEGGTASHEEVLLIVGLASTLCTYLSTKNLIIKMLQPNIKGPSFRPGCRNPGQGW